MDSQLNEIVLCQLFEVQKVLDVGSKADDKGLLEMITLEHLEHEIIDQDFCGVGQKRA